MTEYIQLLRKMAHDMRVPLNTLISTSDMLADGIYDPLTPKQTKAALRLQRNSQRLLAILDDFITYMKAGAKDLTLSPKAFDPRTQLTEWCEPIRKASQEKGLTFDISTAVSVPSTVSYDEAMLKRIVQALAWNALAYTTDGGIQVTSEWSSEQGWLITVKDSGSGISETDLPHIFEPFWRGEERPQLPTAGAGLGLPMAQALATLMGGSLFLKETTDSGCSFCVRLNVQNETSDKPQNP